MMPVAKIANSAQTIELERKPLQMTIDGTDSEILTFVLPPIEDINEVHAIEAQHASLQRISDQDEKRFRNELRAELALLEEKRELFGQSPTFLNRMANLALIIGDRRAEAKYLEDAISISDDPLFLHRKGENFVAQSKFDDAEFIFKNMDLGKDVYANLRVASFFVMRGEHSTAQEYVSRAIAIDPLDYSARLFEGVLHVMFRRLPEAVLSFKLAIEERPNSASAYCNLAIAYKMMGISHKALSALKRSNSMDPLNPYIVCLLADVAFENESDEEALAGLRYFVQFEHSKPEVWARIGRACVRLKLFDDAIFALKREAALTESCAVWNNLGVCYYNQKDGKKALSTFKHALNLGDDKAWSGDQYLAARNAAQTLLDRAEFEQVLDVTEYVLERDRDFLCLRSKHLCDLYAMRLQALFKTDHFNKAVHLGKEILAAADVCEDLVIWTVSTLIGVFSLKEGLLNDAEDLVERYKEVLVEPSSNRDQWSSFVNNVAFALAESGHTSEAEHVLSKISSRLHKDAYPTATLGLIHLRRRHLDRAKELYEEAIHLAVTPYDKARIRQKLNLEFGKHFSTENSQRAKRYLEKVVNVKLGEKALEDRAQKLIRSLPTERR